MSVEITLNGETTLVDAEATIADLVALHAPSSRGVAVARDLEMIPRSTWSSTPIRPGDDIEILAAAQGG